MSEAAPRYKTGLSTPHCFRREPASRGKMAGRSSGTVRLAPDHRSAMPLESCPMPELGTPERANNRADHGNTARLLLISDDPALMPEQLRGTFPPPAHQVQVAGTVDAGLEHIRIESADVIVLDLGLSGQPGQEVYHQIRHMHAHLPVIVVAGASRADAVIEPIMQGAYDCLFKPLDLPLLLGIARRTLRTKLQDLGLHVARSVEADEDEMP